MNQNENSSKGSPRKNKELTAINQVNEFPQKRKIISLT